MGKWGKLKAKSNPLKNKNWSPAVGKYNFLNQIWRPVHRIQFLDPNPPAPVSGQRVIEEEPLLKVLITSLNVTDRPDLMVFERKGSIQDAVKFSGSAGSDDGEGSEGRGSVSSVDASNAMDEDNVPLQDPSNLALPTMLMAGTILGSVFRADLSKNKVDVETNNLRNYTFKIDLLY
jgi:hypothetical protein